MSLVQDYKVSVERVTPEVADSLEELGGHEVRLANKRVWILEAADRPFLGTLFGQLRDTGILFEAEPAGWPPAEVIEDLREKGFVSGEFQELVWYSPGHWTVQKR